MQPDCLQTMLHSCRVVAGHEGTLRVYQCPQSGLTCVISGVGQDEELLLLACDRCAKEVSVPLSDKALVKPATN